LRSIVVALVVALSVASCFSGPSLNRPPYRYNEPLPAAPAPAKAESAQPPEQKAPPATAPVAPLPPATPPANPGG